MSIAHGFWSVDPQAPPRSRCCCHFASLPASLAHVPPLPPRSGASERDKGTRAWHTPSGRTTRKRRLEAAADVTSWIFRQVSCMSLRRLQEVGQAKGTRAHEHRTRLLAGRPASAALKPLLLSLRDTRNYILCIIYYIIYYIFYIMLYSIIYNMMWYSII